MKPSADESLNPKRSRGWSCAYTLDRERRPVAGSAEALADAIRGGADLRIYTEFRHNEHIDTASSNAEVIKEVADFRITYLVEGHWVAGIINLRQPIALPDGFGPRPSMSLFLYNQDGSQAIARPYLDGLPTRDRPAGDDHRDMPKYHLIDAWDQDTNAPSSNFIYDFETYRFLVRDDWAEVFAHTGENEVLSGSIDALVEAFANGCEVKVGIRNLNADLTDEPAQAVPHEVFVQCGSCYYYTGQRLFMAASQPVVRVRPTVPMRYKSRNWDFGWLLPRSDGHVARLLVDPVTLKFHRGQSRHAIRWFVR